MRRELIAIMVSVGATLFMSGCREQVSSTTGAKEYELQKIELSDFTTSALYTASVRGQQDIDIYPQVSGYLQHIAVKEGQTVKKGDVLFIIEPAPYLAAYNATKASVAISKAAVATAELDYNNSKMLNETEIISDSELQTAYNALMSAKGSLELSVAQALAAKTNLDFTKILSPSDGVVGKLPYRNGALVSSALAQSLTVISDNSQMYVYFSMSESQIYALLDNYGSLDSAIEQMPDLELRLSSGSTYQHKGELESISGVIDSSTGAVSLRAVFDNPERKLLSGSTATIVMPQTFEDVIVIPKSATYDLQDKIFVYRVVDGAAKSTAIEVAKGMSDKEYVVTSGLKVGEEIIASGAGLVREGTIVK